MISLPSTSELQWTFLAYSQPFSHLMELILKWFYREGIRISFWCTQNSTKQYKLNMLEDTTRRISVPCLQVKPRKSLPFYIQQSQLIYHTYNPSSSVYKQLWRLQSKISNIRSAVHKISGVFQKCCKCRVKDLERFAELSNENISSKLSLHRNRFDQ